MFVRAGLRAVSTSFMLARYFVLIDVKVEKADSHKYVETNGRRTRIAKSANTGYCTLRLSQKVSFFTAKSASTSNQRKVQQILLEHSEREMLDALI